MVAMTITQASARVNAATPIDRLATSLAWVDGAKVMHHRVPRACIRDKCKRDPRVVPGRVRSCQVVSGRPVAGCDGARTRKSEAHGEGSARNMAGRGFALV